MKSTKSAKFQQTEGAASSSSNKSQREPTTDGTSTPKSIRSVRSRREEDYIERYIMIPPDGGWSWMIVFGAFITYFVADGILFSFGIFLQDISETFQCTKSEVSLAGAIKSGIFSLSGPLSASLINKFGYRKISVFGSLLAMLSSALSSQSPSLLWLIFFHGVIGGFGFGMIYVTAVTVIGFYFERYRALATGLAVCGAGFGGIAMPPILSLLLIKVGWRHTFISIALMTICCLLCGLLFRPLKPVRIRLIESKSTAIVINTTASTSTKKISSFFNRYHNTTYPTIIDAASGSLKLMKTRSTEVLLTTYNSTSTTESNAVMIESNKDSQSINYDKVEVAKKCCYLRRKGTVGQEEDQQYVCCCWCTGCRRNIEDSDDDQEYGCVCCRRREQQIKISTRPMYRDDIFYTGSIAQLPEYKNSRMSNMSNVVESKSKGFLEYHMSITRVTTHREIMETSRRRCKCCPEPMKRIIATMLDFRLLKSPPFLLLGINAVFTSMGFYTPYMFIKDRAIQHGIGADTAFWFISTIGLTNTVGRILCGILSTFPRVRADVLSYMFLLVGGVATILSSLSVSINYQFGYCAVYGMSMSCMSALRTTLIVEMLGLEKLTNAVGIILMFQGISSLIGTTIAAYLIQFSGDYVYSFYFAGIMICLAAVMLVPLKHVS